MAMVVPKIAPSILSANFAKLGEEVAQVIAAGAAQIHCDVMDGHFVPNITFGAPVIASLRPLTTLPLDVHLMIAPVDQHLEAFAKAGADAITIHPEAGAHLHRSLQTIKALGKRAGVALNPATPLGVIAEVLPLLDIILIMSVNPGFGGQSFIPDSLPKIRAARSLVSGHKRAIDIAVDGGINANTAPAVIEAGANVLIAGTAIFHSEDYASAIRALKPAEAV